MKSNIQAVNKGRDKEACSHEWSSTVWIKKKNYVALIEQLGDLSKVPTCFLCLQTVASVVKTL